MQAEMLNVTARIRYITVYYPEQSTCSTPGAVRFITKHMFFWASLA